MISTRESNLANEWTPEHVNLPSPSLWPLLLALGVALGATGLLTNIKVAWVGGILSLVGGLGWIFQVLPHEHHEAVPINLKPEVIAPSARKLTRLEAEKVPHRARLPLEIYPISAGLKGGLAGSVAMAALAVLYGLISHHSIWYPINLLGGVVYADTQMSTTWLNQFHVELFAVAALLHITGSILVGLLYGAVLPMLPRRPVLLGGFFAPIAWTGLLYSVLGIVNPLLNARIHWGWFLASQFAFGVVAGLVVVRQVRIPTWQYPLAVRIGLEAPGIMGEDQGNRPS